MLEWRDGMGTVAGKNSISIDSLEHLTGDEKKAISEIKERVIGVAGSRLKGLYVFGSKARGDYDAESDVDVAILVDDLDNPMKRRIIDIVVEVETRYLVIISSLVLSWKEFSHLLERERRLALDIEKEGIPI
ncbi:MAG: nucleotidyltransferase domain-containing protein [Bacteroidota bacterium]